MDKKKILTVFGTRPEAVKMAPLVLELKQRDGFDCKVCVTAQHREMLDAVNELFGIVPDFDLDIMENNQSLCGIYSKVVAGMEKVIKEYSPDLVLVHGDTSTSVAAAMAAFLCGVKVGHVEAGLRTWDRQNPFPEEFNRVITAQCTALHFCPTKKSQDNLSKEGIIKGVHITGNTVIDALRYTVDKAYDFKSPQISGFFAKYEKIVVMTAHRRENFGEGLKNIFTAVATLANKYKDVGFIYPVHPNPNVKPIAHELLSGFENVLLTEPVCTKEMHNMLARCHMVLTDSGGLQEEAPSLGKPVLLMRHETERPEAVDAGTVRIVGTDPDTIIRFASLLIDNSDEYEKMASSINPYGDGYSSARIAEIIATAI